MAIDQISNGELGLAVRTKLNSAIDQLNGLGTASTTNETAYDAAGTASSAISTHTTTIDHGPISTALQPDAIGTSITPTAIGAVSSTIDETIIGQKTFSGGYNEVGVTLTQNGVDLTIPINGKTYKLVPSANITNVLTTRPTPPNCSGCTVYIVQGTTGYSMVIPSSWKWPNDMITNISTVPNAITRLILSTDPDGRVHADAESRGLA